MIKGIVNKMTEKKGFKKNVWIVIMILSIVFIVMSLFIMSNGENVLKTGLELAGSNQSTEDIEEKALSFINMSMLKPLWEGIWMGIFGLLIAFGLKKKINFAWILGIVWGVMWLVNAAIQGGYEMLILGWSSPCVQTYLFLILGLISLPILLIAKN
jgi:hypothetical protein